MLSWSAASRSHGARLQTPGECALTLAACSVLMFISPEFGGCYSPLLDLFCSSCCARDVPWDGRCQGGTCLFRVSPSARQLTRRTCSCRGCKARLRGRPCVCGFGRATPPMYMRSFEGGVVIYFTQGGIGRPSPRASRVWCPDTDGRFLPVPIPVPIYVAT